MHWAASVSNQRLMGMCSTCAACHMNEAISSKWLGNTIQHVCGLAGSQVQNDSFIRHIQLLSELTEINVLPDTVLPKVAYTIKPQVESRSMKQNHLEMEHPLAGVQCSQCKRCPYSSVHSHSFLVFMRCISRSSKMNRHDSC
jgi:hypothetical protein